MLPLASSTISLRRQFWIAAILLLAAASLCSAQTESVLARFNARSDGAGPRGGLIADSAGNLYGTTSWGGDGTSQVCRNGLVGDCGTVFELSPPAPGSGKWTETVLHRFTTIPDGSYPVGNLVMDSAGNLYGTTASGGDSQNHGIIYQVSPPAVAGDPWTETVIYRFSGPDGQTPSAGLVIDASGNLYGTTSYGGICGLGTAFELSPPVTQGGAWTQQVIHNFRRRCNGHVSNDGAAPLAGLAIGPGGTLLGTTEAGGQYDYGTAFALVPPHGGILTWTEKVIYNFTGASDGRFPLAGLAIDHGNAYGTTAYGGDGTCTYEFSGCGVVFQLTPAGPGNSWILTTIYTFTGSFDGQNPFAGVILDKKGNVFGTTTGGGNTNCNDNYSVGCGVVYEVSPPVNAGDPWTQSTLYAFTGDVDGRMSVAPLVIGKSGALYGTSFSGGNMQCTDYGSAGCGTVFKVVP